MKRTGKLCIWLFNKLLLLFFFFLCKNVFTNTVIESAKLTNEKLNVLWSAKRYHIAHLLIILHYHFFMYVFMRNVIMLNVYFQFLFARKYGSEER